MLQQNTLEFIKKLTANNNRDWFNENKKLYENAKADFEKLVEDLIFSISNFDFEIKYLNPKKCIFRIYRDTRFSLDKRPYKNNLGAFLSAHGKQYSGYYLHIEPQKSILACGYYSGSPESLKKIRNKIYTNFEIFNSIINEKNLITEFGGLVEDTDKLKRVPVGFDKEHPSAEYLKLKHFYISKSITDKQLTSSNFVEYASKLFSYTQNFNEYLNDTLTE